VLLNEIVYHILYMYYQMYRESLYVCGALYHLYTVFHKICMNIQVMYASETHGQTVHLCYQMFHHKLNILISKQLRNKVRLFKYLGINFILKN